MKKMRIGTMPKDSLDMVEAFNRLRVNLEFCGKKVKTIMITSSVSGEGKTFVAMQLWKQLSEAGVSTLLIDCDLQNSRLCSEYKMRNETEIDGITQYLSGRVKLEDVVYETDQSNGYILPVTAFAEKPEVLLASKRFSQMLEECTQKWECILIDTPCIDKMADVMNIATYCDGTVLVVRSASTSRKTVGDCVQALQRTGTPLLGIVLNRMGINNKSSAYFYRHRN